MTQTEKPVSGVTSLTGSQANFDDEQFQLTRKPAEQIGLFGDPRRQATSRSPIFARKDPGTSRLAAETLIESGAITNQKAAIVRFLRKCPGSYTCGEIAAKSGLDYHDVARRMSAIERDGDAQRAGVRECSIRKRPCQAWRVK